MKHPSQAPIALAIASILLLVSVPTVSSASTVPVAVLHHGASSDSAWHVLKLSLVPGTALTISAKAFKLNCPAAWSFWMYSGPLGEEGVYSSGSWDFVEGQSGFEASASPGGGSGVSWSNVANDGESGCPSLAGGITIRFSGLPSTVYLVEFASGGPIVGEATLL